MEYKNTLNLPQTDFPIKANFKVKEPELLAFWHDHSTELGVKDKKKGKYILHDGPPYPNGDIHLGHALNKILKDIVVKFKSMEGYEVPYLPGWDCHGLPIETQLLKELSIRKSSLSIYEFRQKCREYALKYVEIQKEQFKRLGILGKWEEPYLTLNKSYEAGVVELFGILADEGYVYKSLKPIHWCPNCETALAEAEIEYEDDPSPSIFVRFTVKENNSKNPKVEEILKPKQSHYIIWTTTPWTLPSNVAIAVHPDFEYCAVQNSDQIYIIAKELIESAAKSMKWEGYIAIETFKGCELEGIICSHPFIERNSQVVLDEFVTLETGTGCVHIAPGHGEEDFKVGQKYKLPIVMPVNGKGCFTEEVPFLEGQHVWKANPIILEKMKENGSLLSSETVKHQYPHCWRCKKPVIFRATEQWFINVDHKDMRQKALKEIENVEWYPAWGENRIRGMVEQRPDWCISRQRSWGIPIPAFYCEKCGKPNFKGDFNKAAVKLMRENGSDAWFTKEADEILPKGIKCEFCGNETFRKETDIMDVWLESGSSHYSVLKQDSKTFSWPADLYLEGSDQHRGWFQTSLLTSTGAFSMSPFKAVLTHGFTCDEKGKKMSKSLGNVINPQDVVNEFGADVLRLWVASTDFRNDMALSKNILKQISEGFSKIRNTCRFMLSNINDFDFKKEKISYKDLKEIDKFALLKLSKLIGKIHEAYDAFEFHVVYHSLYSFCVNDLSAFYLDIIKDRLYCDAKTSKSRMAAQTAIYEILTSIVKMMAPILSFTSEDIYKHIDKSGGSIFFEELPFPNKEYESKELEERWDKILEVRGEVFKKIEELRNSKAINQGSECDVAIKADEKTGKILNEIKNDLPETFMVSSVIINIAGDEALPGGDVAMPRPYSIIVSKTKNSKCERCWRFLPDIGKSAEHPTLCGRCADAVKDFVIK